MTAPKLSFSFSKQKKSLLVPPTTSQVGPNSDKTPIREYVTSIEDNVIKSESVSKTPPIVVPLIINRNGIQSRLRTKHAKVEPSDELTRQALNELKSEARGEHIHESSNTSAFMVSLVGSASAPDEVEDVNYDAVPVEKFGLAVLAGMGFNPEELKSTKDEPLGPTRPKGLGLGADPHAVRAARQDSKSGSGEQLSWSPGAHCQAILGKHKGQYGIVNGIDGDTGRVVVKFTISKEIVPILQPMLRLVRKEEYNKYANCLNQADVDRYKAEEHDSSAASTIQPTLNGKSADSRLRETSSELSSASKRKDPHSWIRSNLIVRFLDKHYHHGRYYKHKVKVIGVDSNRCTCQTEDGRIIEDVQPRYLQTVVPKAQNSEVMILRGSREGEMAKIVHQDLAKDEVDLRTKAGTTIRLSYNHVCLVANRP